MAEIPIIMQMNGAGALKAAGGTPLSDEEMQALGSVTLTEAAKLAPAGPLAIVPAHPLALTFNAVASHEVAPDSVLMAEMVDGKLAMYRFTAAQFPQLVAKAGQQNSIVAVLDDELRCTLDIDAGDAGVEAWADVLARKVGPEAQPTRIGGKAMPLVNCVVPTATLARFAVMRLFRMICEAYPAVVGHLHEEGLNIAVIGDSSEVQFALNKPVAIELHHGHLVRREIPQASDDKENLQPDEGDEEVYDLVFDALVSADVLVARLAVAVYQSFAYDMGAIDPETRRINTEHFGRLGQVVVATVPAVLKAKAEAWLAASKSKLSLETQAVPHIYDHAGEATTMPNDIPAFYEAFQKELEMAAPTAAEGGEDTKVSQPEKSGAPLAGDKAQSSVADDGAAAKSTEPTGAETATGSAIGLPSTVTNPV